jgi:hypothetical protein
MTDAVRPLAAEDVGAGDCVVVMQVTVQVPSFFWCSDPSFPPRPDVVNLNFMPCESGQPLAVISVCLPFVLVESYDGTRKTLDLRQCRVARVSPEFAAKVRKSLQKNK